MNRMQSAFTLIELLIVVSIIAILAAIAVPNFLEARVRANNSRAVSDMRTITTGLESYRIDNNEYPPGWIEVGNPINDSGAIVGLIEPKEARLKPLTTPISYLSTIPRDPFLKGVQTDERQTAYSYWHPEHADAHRIDNDGPDGHVGHFMTPDLFQDVPGESTRYGRYVLTSAGPDGQVEPPEHALPGATLAVYDPTNGSISKGMIWRFGP